MRTVNSVPGGMLDVGVARDAVGETPPVAETLSKGGRSGLAGRWSDVNTFGCREHPAAKLRTKISGARKTAFSDFMNRSSLRLAELASRNADAIASSR
jgi:hypothetical protein